jgi:CRP-like cAMP-binding protein
MSASEMQAAFIAALLKKDNKRTEVDRYVILNFLRNAGFYHSKLLESISSFASVEICKTDLIIYAQHEMVGLQYWYLLKGEVQLYSSKKARFQYIKSGASMHATRESLAELGKFEYTVNQGDFFGVESFVKPDPHAERSNTAVVTKDGTITLPIQGATPLRHATDFILFPHQYQVRTLSDWCKIPPEFTSDHSYR